jgi:putative transcriptional regulator
MLYIYNTLYYLCNMESRKLYNRINLLRKERGMSRQELADKIGVNVQTIGYLEREEYNPSLDLAFRISEVFELPIDMIFSTGAFKSISEILKENSNNKHHE